MNESVFKARLKELVQEIGPVPASCRTELDQIVKKSGEKHKKLSSDVEKLQESLDYLRLSIKYLVFDLEATKRENATLKKKLERKND